ncbi:MAG TPA: chorismate synthase [Clostridia bacterium]|nr:chorismate synthase [Clostridia bacterium]
MSSQIGNKIKVQIFGQSHSKAIGVVIDGLPAGIRLDMEKINSFMQKRAPGKNDYSTKRKETDNPQILSGVFDGTTVGAPLCAIIENTDARPADYSKIKDMPRPGHADFSAFAKFGEYHDIRGGGFFSGRMTAPLCFAGAVCMQLLEEKGITVGAHIFSIGNEKDLPFDSVDIDANDLKNISQKPFAVIDDSAGERMKIDIKNVADEGDSLGGVIECAIVGISAGVGEPMFDGIENNLSKAVFGIPAIKGIEFGAGFASTFMKGSQNNDEFYFDKKSIKTKTNNNGGILGGISTGMPIVFRVAVKPTPSIGKEQNTISFSKKCDTKLVITGRHDPCIVPRAVPCIEAVAAIVIADYLA